MFKFVDYKNADEENYSYAVCWCTPANRGIEIPRKEYSDYVRFKCPNCGEPLGMMVLGKAAKRQGKTFSIT